MLDPGASHMLLRLLIQQSTEEERMSINYY